MVAITVTLEDQERLGILPGALVPMSPTARELTAADPIASLPGKVNRSRASQKRRGAIKALRSRKG